MNPKDEGHLGRRGFVKTGGLAVGSLSTLGPPGISRGTRQVA
jgi:hypothetical protein